MNSALISEALQTREISSLYEIYNNEATSDEDKVTLGKYIVEIAQEDLHEKIVIQTPFDYDLKRERFVLKILYELALSSYESDELFEAKEQFALLSVMSNHTGFSKAMQMHTVALLLNVAYEDFLAHWINKDSVDAFYLYAFSEHGKKEYLKAQKQLDQYIEPMKKLFVQGI